MSNYDTPDTIDLPFEDDAYEMALDNADLDHMEQMDNEQDQFMTDAEADADALASCGLGTDEDYGGDHGEGDW